MGTVMENFFSLLAQMPRAFFMWHGDMSFGVVLYVTLMLALTWASSFGQNFLDEHDTVRPLATAVALILCLLSGGAMHDVTTRVTIVTPANAWMMILMAAHMLSAVMIVAYFLSKYGPERQIH